MWIHTKRLATQVVDTKMNGAIGEKKIPKFLHVSRILRIKVLDKKTNLMEYERDPVYREFAGLGILLFWLFVPEAHSPIGALHRGRNITILLRIPIPQMTGRPKTILMYLRPVF